MRKLKFRFWKEKNLQGILELKKGGIIDMGWEWDSVDQFTGLFDKFGKEIYEGDIVRAAYPRETITGKVIYRDTGALFLIEYQEFSFNFSYECRTYEIIGNIYETPELLESPLGNNAEPIRNLPEDNRREDR